MKIVSRNNCIAFALALLVSLFGAVVVAAQSSGYAVSFADRTATVGDTIEVEWETPADRPSQMWVGVYRAGANDRQFTLWKYLPQGGTAGSISFRVTKVGTYEVRLFTGNAYDRVAVGAATLVVTDGSGQDDDDEDPPEKDASVTVNDATYAPRESVPVTYTLPTAPRSNTAWIGIYRPSATDRQFTVWRYLPQGSRSGTLTFSLTAEGTYEARLFSSSYNRVAVSEERFTIAGEEDPDEPPTSAYELGVTPRSIETGASVTVSFSAPSSANRYRDWVGMYRTGGNDRAYLDFEYTGGRTSGSVSFVPPSPGEYEFRYFKNNGFTRVAVSPTLTVRAADGGGGGQCRVADLDDIVNIPAPRNRPIIAFGDSLTAGVGASTNQDYVSQLERKAGVTIINEGVSGDTTEDALDRLQSDVLSRNPSVVIVWLGGNDIIGRFYDRARQGLEEVSTSEWLQLLTLRLTGKIPDTTGISENETFENITEIIERIQARGAVTIVVGFSGGIFDKDLEERYREVAEDTGSLYVPNVLDGVLGRPSRMSDLVHPNNVGYGIVADRVLPYLTCALPS